MNKRDISKWEKLNKKLDTFHRKVDHFFFSDHFKILNFVVTSDNDSSYVKKEKLNFARIMRLIYFFIILIVTSLTFFPLFLIKPEQIQLSTQHWLVGINIFAFIILVFDYFLRWITYPTRIKKSPALKSIFIFPFSGISIIMIISILPTLLSILTVEYGINDGFIKLVKAFVGFKILRLILLLKVISSFDVFIQSFIKQKNILINVFIFVFSLALIFALIIYSVEPDITSYWEALYFTIITMTTIGYGDIVPHTPAGKVIVSFVAILGITIFTIPSGILAASFTYEMQQKFKENKNKNNHLYKNTLLKKFLTKKQKQVEWSENDAKAHQGTYVIENINLNLVPEIKEKVIALLGGDNNIRAFKRNDNDHYHFEVEDIRLISNDLFELARILNFEVNKK